MECLVLSNNSNLLLQTTFSLLCSVPKTYFIFIHNFVKCQLIVTILAEILQVIWENYINILRYPTLHNLFILAIFFWLIFIQISHFLKESCLMIITYKFLMYWRQERSLMVTPNAMAAEMHQFKQRAWLTTQARQKQC